MPITRRISPNRMPALVRRVFFEPPPIAPGESADDYMQHTMQFAAVHDPKNTPQWFWVAHFADRYWELARLRRLQAGLMHVAIDDNAELVERVNQRLLTVNRQMVAAGFASSAILLPAGSPPTMADAAKGYQKIASQYANLALLIERVERAITALLRQKEVLFAGNLPVIIDAEQDAAATAPLIEHPRHDR